VFECFVAGTNIMTPEGDRPVEALRVGDAVVTASGGFQTIVWIGRRRVDLDRHPRPDAIQPVRIAADAFAPAVPRRDLYLSPGHRIFVADVLIPASALINGTSVTRVTWRSVDYYHVELERHDVMLAENLPAESYADCGHRRDFEGGQAPTTLHPMFAYACLEADCAPTIVHGPILDDIRRHLARRAALGALARLARRLVGALG
jgi:hypothetical protein